MFKDNKLKLGMFFTLLIAYTLFAIFGGGMVLAAENPVRDEKAKAVTAFNDDKNFTEYKHTYVLSSVNKVLLSAENLSYVRESDTKEEAVVSTDEEPSVLTFSGNDVNWDSVPYDSDLYWLAKLVMAEAEGEPYKGKVAVGNVVINRVNHEDYESTVKDVIFAKGQFSPVDDGRINLTPNQESLNAAYDVLYNKAFIEEMNPNILYFNTFGKWWDGISVAFKIGNHYFGQQNY